MNLAFSARQRLSWVTSRATVDERFHGSVCCRSKKERQARVRATPLDLRAWRANAGVNATRSIKVESLYPGTLLITRGAHSPRPAVSLPLIAADVAPSVALPASSLSESRPYYETVHAIQRDLLATWSLILINLYAMLANACSHIRRATTTTKTPRSFIKRHRLWS